ncbi:MAG: glycosyltransferase family 4 protein [Bacteroidota bacterium]
MTESNNSIKLVRITTVALSLKYLLPGQMKFMREHGFDVTMMSAAGNEIPFVEAAEGCTFHEVPLSRTINPVQDLKCIWHLYRWLKKYKPQIIHSETPKAGLVGMISGLLAGVPVRIHTVAGLPLMVEKGFKYWLLVWVERITNACATNVWPNSFSLQKIMLQKKLARPGKMQVLAYGSSNGTNTSRYSAASIIPGRLAEIKAQINYDDRLLYNLCVARLVKDKGIAELVEAFSTVYNQDDRQRLLLVGPYEKHLDPLPEPTIQLIDTHPGIIRVAITDAVEYFLFIARIFIFPSYREGFPNVVMEAGSMGIPVVCSRIEGNVDMVDHEVTGLLFESQNTADLLDKWTYAIKNPEIMRNMGEALQQKIRKYYDRTVIWNAIHQAYRQLAKPVN